MAAINHSLIATAGRLIVDDAEWEVTWIGESTIAILGMTEREYRRYQCVIDDACERQRVTRILVRDNENKSNSVWISL